MPRGPKPKAVRLAPRIRRELEWTAHSGVAAHRRVQRARIILLSAKTISTPAIARQVGCSERTVRKWRSRFLRQSTMASLKDDARSGRPPQVQVETRCELVK